MHLVWATEREALCMDLVNFFDEGVLVVVKLEGHHGGKPIKRAIY